jgi:Ca-activated chloride channel homolog
MRVGLECVLSDANLDALQTSSQRQISLSIAAMVDEGGGAIGRESLERQAVPLNLCLILDRSGSMEGKPIETVKRAAQTLVEQLAPGDRITVVSFSHKAQVLVENQVITDARSIQPAISRLEASGGTAIDEGLRLGIEETAKGKKDAVSQMFLLTDGENEHGDNERCLKLAHLATSYNLTLNSLGFGDGWNQDVLEKIADAGGGTLSFIERPEQAANEFNRLFNRMQTVGLTNAFLILTLAPGSRLAELKPIAQVAPDTIELAVQQEGDQVTVRLGDLMVDDPRIVLANLYIGQLAMGEQTIAYAQVRYDDPASGQTGLLSEHIPILGTVRSDFAPAPNATVQNHILALAKYRQTQIAEQKLQQGDRMGAATMLQTAAKTALQMGDQGAATVLQNSASQLEAGKELSEADRKKTRIVSKTTLQE